MLLQLAQIAGDFADLTGLCKATGHPVGVLTLVVGGLLVVAMVMAALRIKWGLVLGIIAGTWMIFQPVMVGAIGVQLGQSVAWWQVLLKVTLALLLIYFCALAWKKVCHDDDLRENVQQ